MRVSRTEYHYHNTQSVPYSGRSYGCLGFMGDLLMTVVSGGTWLIWVFVREMRRR